MQDLSLEVRLAELESRLAFQEITIEELNVTVTAPDKDSTAPSIPRMGR